MRQRLVSQTDKQRETDRQGWADLSELAYRVHVTGCGEALEGPYYFGRAYEAPPAFTWSGVPSQASGGLTTVIPLLTVGVQSWIQDSKGMYVGAHLWFKVKDQVGTVGCDVLVCVAAPDDAEPIRWTTSTENVQLGPIADSIGENILTDPSFEDYPWADDPPIPAFPVTNYNYDTSPLTTSGLVWLDGSGTYLWDQMVPVVEPPGWYHIYSDIDDFRHWTISTEDPRSGTYHAKWTSIDGWSRVPPELASYGGSSCTPRRVRGGPTPYGRIYFPYSARVQPGDLVEFTIWAKTFGSSAQLGYLYLDWWDASGNQNTTDVSDENWELSNTEYRKMTYAVVAPEGSEYVMAVVDWNFQMTVGDGVYVDDGELKVICNSDKEGHDCGVVFDDNFSTAVNGWPGTLWEVHLDNTVVVWARSGHALNGGSYVYEYAYDDGGGSPYPTTPDPMSPGWGGAGGVLISSGNPLATGGWAAGMSLSTTQQSAFNINVIPKVAGYASGLIWNDWSGDYTALVRAGDRVTVTFDAMLTDHLSTTVMREDNRIRVSALLAQVQGKSFSSGNYIPSPRFQVQKSSAFNTYEAVLDIPEIDGWFTEGGPYYLYVSLAPGWRSDAINNYAYDSAASTAPITKWEEYWIDNVKVEVDCAPTGCRDVVQYVALLANGNAEPEAQAQRLGLPYDDPDDLPSLLFDGSGYKYFWPTGGQYDTTEWTQLDSDAVVRLWSGVEGPPWRTTDARKYQNYLSLFRPFSNQGSFYGTGWLNITTEKWTCDTVDSYASLRPYLTAFNWGDQASIVCRYWVDSLDTNMEVVVSVETQEGSYDYAFPVTTAGSWVFLSVFHRFRNWDEIDSEGYGLWLEAAISARHSGTYTGNFYVDALTISLNQATSPWS